jgi:hypothetical protein
MAEKIIDKNGNVAWRGETYRVEEINTSNPSKDKSDYPFEIEKKSHNVESTPNQPIQNSKGWFHISIVILLAILVLGLIGSGIWFNLNFKDKQFSINVPVNLPEQNINNYNSYNFTISTSTNVTIPTNITIPIENKITTPPINLSA